MKKTRRELRCEPQFYNCDKEKEKDVLKFENGKIGGSENIIVKDNSLTFKFKAFKEDHGVYPDDAIAVIRDLLMSFNPDPKKDIHTVMAINYLQKAIEELDKRANKRHGYSGSKEEKEFVPTYMK